MLPELLRATMQVNVYEVELRTTISLGQHDTDEATALATAVRHEIGKAAKSNDGIGWAFTIQTIDQQVSSQTPYLSTITMTALTFRRVEVHRLRRYIQCSQICRHT